MSVAGGHPTHLDPSELGTREYWDAHYANDLSLLEPEDEPESPSELSSWFDDVDAPSRIIKFLTSDTFPLSPNYRGSDSQLHSPASILDLGTGNGSMLFQLRLTEFNGPMLGLDYSRQSIELAGSLARLYKNSNVPARVSSCPTIQFEVMDLIRDDATTQPWWSAEEGGEGFDLVLDKGTFDAISLSSDIITTTSNGKEHRICDLYPGKASQLVKPGGYLLVTSCNWTEEEVVRWFTTAGEGMTKLEVYGTIKYPKFKFGGQEGQGVASVCFKRVS